MLSKDKQPDFYLTGFARSPEHGDDWQKVRACWVQDKIIEKDKTEYLLIKISPSVKCDSWELEDREIEDVLVQRLHSETSIDPISEWPLSVFAYGLINESVLKNPPGVDNIYHGNKPTDLEKQADFRLRTNLSLQAYCELYTNHKDAEKVVGVRPEYPMEISKLKDIDSAKKSFHSVFVSGDFKPFQQDIKQRMVLFCDRFIEKIHFDAIKEAASAIGESKAYISLTGGYRAIEKRKVYENVAAKHRQPLDDKQDSFFKLCFEKRDHYIIDLNYRSYEDLNEREYPLAFPLSFLEYSIYSTRGTWGIILEEDYALVGGSQAFMDSLKSHEPGIEKEVREYLRYMRDEIKSGAHADIVRGWLPSMIEHIYGPAAAHSMLEESGLENLLI